MTSPDRDPVRELIEQARELRRSEQPPAEFFEAALRRLRREELTLERSSSSSSCPSHLLNGAGRWLLRRGPARLWLAVALALAFIVSWGARRRTAIDAQQDEPGVAFAPEPARVPDATRTVELDDHLEQPGAELSAEQRPALPATPSPLLPLSEPLRRAEAQMGASGSHESSSGLHFGASPMASGSDPFYQGAPPASILWLDDAGAARIESSDDKRKVAGFWTAVPKRTEADAGAEQASAVAAAAEENARRAAQPRGEPEKPPAERVGEERSADKTPGTKEHGKEDAAPKRSTKKPADKPAGPPKADCDPPWYIDTKGIQRLKPECSTKKPAGPPKGDCNPPWYIDAEGIRRLKPECL